MRVIGGLYDVLGFLSSVVLGMAGDGIGIGLGFVSEVEVGIPYIAYLPLHFRCIDVSPVLS